MNANSYFRFVSFLTVSINLLVGIGAIYLIERIVPAIDEILNENAYSVSSVLEMQRSLSLSLQNGQDEKIKEEFWQSLENATRNVTVEGESQIIQDIHNLAETYWKGSTAELIPLSDKLKELSELNLKSMQEKNQKAKALGLAGAWALGFLILTALVLQLSVRKKMFESLVQPATSLITVIMDYHHGNRQRRFSNTPATAHEIRKSGEILNRILDENLSSLDRL